MKNWTATEKENFFTNIFKLVDAVILVGVLYIMAR